MTSLPAARRWEDANPCPGHVAAFFPGHGGIHRGDTPCSEHSCCPYSEACPSRRRFCSAVTSWSVLGSNPRGPPSPGALHLLPPSTVWKCKRSFPTLQGKSVPTQALRLSDAIVFPLQSSCPSAPVRPGQRPLSRTRNATSVLSLVPRCVPLLVQFELSEDKDFTFSFSWSQPQHRAGRLQSQCFTSACWIRPLPRM